jgi:hypothetical protein
MESKKQYQVKSNQGVSWGEGTGLRGDGGAAGRSAAVGKKGEGFKEGGRSEEGGEEGEEDAEKLLESGCKLVFGFLCLAEPNKPADGDG